MAAERRPTRPKLACPFCAHPFSSVVKSPKTHPNYRSVRRRRRCKGCEKRFWTIEIVDQRKAVHI